MAKDPAFLFYTSDFLTGVIDMSMKERGQYITLLCLQHQRGHLTLKEMEKVAGKLSDEVLGKFIQDDNGKFYNVRADKEIKKRDGHCQKQRENIQKRWNVPKEDVGIYHGITTVIPLENANENIESTRSLEGYGENGEPEVTGDGVQGKDPLIDPELAAVMTLYMDRICASPSRGSTDELIGYTKTLTGPVVLHAINKAADDNKLSWSYVKAILRGYASAKVQSLSDVQRLEDEHETQKQAQARPPARPNRMQTAAEYVPPKSDGGKSLSELQKRLKKEGADA
ncbi:MAG: DnaD domain protein [Oscillospiraceae bacterium]|nr:DnaD domain protein [Oscillospiraceae bacterium]